MERCTRWCFILLDLFWAEETQQNKLPPLECWWLLVPLAVYSAVPFRGVQNNQNKRVAGLFHFASAVSAHRTDGVSFARILLLGRDVAWWG